MEIGILAVCFAVSSSHLNMFFMFLQWRGQENERQSPIVSLLCHVWYMPLWYLSCAVQLEIHLRVTIDWNQTQMQPLSVSPTSAGNSFSSELWECSQKPPQSLTVSPSYVYSGPVSKFGSNEAF